MKEEISPEYLPITFFGKSGVWDYLNAISLSETETSFLHRAFRTRCRLEWEKMDFQFRIMPDDAIGMDENFIEALRISLIRELGEKLPDKDIAVTIKMSDCCGKNCYGCERYDAYE